MSTVKTALIIDDEADIREVLTMMLESGGFQVDVLPDGIDALELKKWYDVILLDLKMPVFDGQRLTDYWQLTDPDVLRRVIVLSGYDRLSRDRELPTFARLAKPFDFKTVMKVVDDCIAQWQAVKSVGGNDV
jgi:CheY-like chemotaxis protein